MPKRRNEMSDFLKLYYKTIDDYEQEEKWKDIILGDYPLYKISNLGRVKNMDGLIINPFHSYRKTKDNKFDLSRPTYLRVQLYYYENGIRKKKHFEVSRLVAMYFIPIPKKYLDLGLGFSDLEVNHKKGGYEIYNNTYRNLEWCTTKENISHAFETGLRHPPFGENHANTFFTVNDVVQICECIEKGFSVRDTFYKINLSSNVSYEHFKPNSYNIKYKNSWRSVSQNYDF